METPTSTTDVNPEESSRKNTGLKIKPREWNRTENDSKSEEGVSDFDD